jgi:hypothetical protein
MTSTPPIGTMFVQAAHLLATHLSDHALPAPAYLEVISETHRSRLIAQVSSLSVPRIAAELLAWADTLTTVTLQAWRPPSSNTVHLSMASTLSTPAGSVELTVYGGAHHNQALLGDLTPGECRAVTLSELRTLATTSGTDREGTSR